ncbi:MAG: helix-turn-helix transcriptional regulator [Blautia sp.]
MLYKSLYSDEIIYSPDLKLSGSMRTEIEDLYERMYLEFASESINYVEILRLSLCELLLKIHRFYRQNHTSPESAVIKYRHQLIPDCIEYLKRKLFKESHYRGTVQQLFLSKSYLSSLFKKATGSGVVEYLQHIRIERACELLTDTSLPITEISFQVGYTGLSFFNKSFKRLPV